VYKIPPRYQCNAVIAKKTFTTLDTVVSLLKSMIVYFRKMIILVADRRSRVSTSIFTSGRSYQYSWSKK